MIWLTTIQFVELVTATCVHRLLECTHAHTSLRATQLYTATSKAVSQLHFRTGPFSNKTTIIMASRRLFRQLFDKESSTYTYLLADMVARQAILIDPVIEQV